MAIMVPNASTTWHSPIAPLTTTPLTMAMWVWTDTSARTPTVRLANANPAVEYWQISQTSAGRARMVAADSSAATTTDTSVAFPTASWKHIAAVFTSSTSRVVYANGGISASSAVSRTPSTVTGLQINGSGNPIAFLAIWDAALTAAEVRQLAQMANPMSIRRQRLVAFWPLAGNGVIQKDEIRGYTLDFSGVSVKQATDPFSLSQTASFRKRIFSFAPPASGGGGVFGGRHRRHRRTR